MVNKKIETLNKKEVCFKCKSEVSYNKKFDCFYCIKCNIWLEPICEDLFCMFCKKRPLRPMKVVEKIEDKKRKVLKW